jgi:quercetin dioxygenase-like cupin family protein
MEKLQNIPWQAYVPHVKVYIKKLFESEHVTEIYAKIEPGGGTIPHFHSGTETLLVLKGEGEIMIGGKVLPLKTECLIQVPGGTCHRVKNTGSDLLHIFSIFTPGFKKQKHSFDP